MGDAKPLKRQLTPLSEAIKVLPVPGSDSLFTASIAWDWCGAWAAHGGHLLGLIHSTAKSYSLLTNPQNPQPDVLNSHIQYLSPVTTSTAVHLSVRVLKVGSQISVLQIELQTFAKSPELDRSSWKTHTLGIVTVGNLISPTGLCFPTRESILRSEMTDRLNDCELVVHPEFFSDIAPVIKKFDTWMLKGYNETMVVSDRFGSCTKDCWFTRSDGGDWNLDYLGVLCDFTEGAPANWSPGREDLKAGVRYPTLCLTMDFKKDPKGLKWVFMRTRSLKIENGRFDTYVYIHDEEGDLLAFAKHLSLIVEGKLLSEHPEEFGRIFKL